MKKGKTMKDENQIKIQGEILTMSICDRLMSMFTIWERIWSRKDYLDIQRMRKKAELECHRLKEYCQK